ncbi:MAG: hypothetical protein AAF604_22865 [Acidobacteriota bacterium]
MKIFARLALGLLFTLPLTASEETALTFHHGNQHDWQALRLAPGPWEVATADDDKKIDRYLLRDCRGRVLYSTQQPIVGDRFLVPYDCADSDGLAAVAYWSQWRSEGVGPAGTLRRLEQEPAKGSSPQNTDSLDGTRWSCIENTWVPGRAVDAQSGQCIELAKNDQGAFEVRFDNGHLVLGEDHVTLAPAGETSLSGRTEGRYFDYEQICEYRGDLRHGKLYLSRTCRYPEVERVDAICWTGFGATCTAK